MGDWKVGDLALCVRVKPDGSDPWEPKKGGVYTVVNLGVGSYGAWLDLAEDTNILTDMAWPLEWFRRIPPLSEEERDSFLADLRQPA